MLVGTAAAATPFGELRVVRFVLALMVGLLLQVAVNYANDYFDGVKGVDTAARVGPRRAVASGLVAPAAMRRAIIVTLALAGLAGLALAVLAGWVLLVVGALAILATLGYSGGSRPYASAALGEVMVFLFFGVVATVGSAYVQDERLTLVPVVASASMGCLACALLVVNNLRDIPTDTVVGKRTLAVRLGERRTRTLYVGLVAVAGLVPVVLTVLVGQVWPLLALAAAPWLGRAVREARTVPIGPGLIAVLGDTARGQLVFAVLLAAGLVLAGGGWP